MYRKKGWQTVIWCLGGLGALLVGGALAVGLNARRMRQADVACHSQLDRSLSLSSPAFETDGPIPLEFSCEGAGGSPPLAWSDAPQGTQSFVLVVIDADIPSPKLPAGEFVHWVLYNIPAQVNELPARVALDALTEMGITVGRNGYGARHYVSPCPVSGAHTYVFRLYALDVAALRLEKDGKADVFQAMEGHVLAYGELTGRYACATMNGWQAMLKNVRTAR